MQHLHDEGPDRHPALVDCLLFLRGSEEVRRPLIAAAFDAPAQLHAVYLMWLLLRTSQG